VSFKRDLSQFDGLSLKQVLSLLVRELQELRALASRPSILNSEFSLPTSNPEVLDSPFFTISQVAERLNLSDRQVRYAIAKGLIEASRFEGKGPGAVRVSAHSLVSYIQRCQVKPRLETPIKPKQPKGKPFKHVKLSAPEGRGSSLDS
jgi:excisionase family DNA binding protein